MKMNVLTTGMALIALAVTGWTLTAAVQGPPRDENIVPNTELPESVTDGVGITFKLIQPGRFMMGSLLGTEDERPVHRVTLTKAFYMSVYEVTLGQWYAIMETYSTEMPSPDIPPDTMIPDSPGNPDLPVELVCFERVEEFCTRLSRREGVRYRLPTEAEWEYACRAGSSTEYYWGKAFDEARLWCKTNSGAGLHLGGQKPSNAWGLYDMLGNASELCVDAYDDVRYPSRETVDPKRKNKVYQMRGGSFRSAPDECRSSAREPFFGFYPQKVSGFRLVREE